MKAKERKMPIDWMGQNAKVQGHGDTIILFTPEQYIETFPTYSFSHIVEITDFFLEFLNEYCKEKSSMAIHL